MPRIGIGIGLGRTFYAGSFADAYNARVIADGGTIEATPCVNAASTLLQSASLLIIPSGYKSGVAYSQLPNNGNGDLTWTRASTANRTNSSGLIESVASGVPRLSYMYGSCPALLLEPQRTNVLQYSEQLDNAIWVKTAINISGNTTATLDPMGGNNADKFIANTTNTAHLILQSGLPSAAYTFSVYAKAGEESVLSLWLRNNSVRAIFDLSNGTISNITVTSATMISVGNGWYRCTVYDSTPGTTASIYGRNGSGYVGNDTDGFYIFGAQVEAGSYATTYIPTTSATATRIADSFSRNNIYTNGLITSSGGTWYVELKNNVSYTRDAGSAGLFLDTSSSGFDYGFALRNSGSPNTRLTIFKFILGASTILHSTTVDNIKIAIKWDGSNCDLFVNGSKITLDAIQRAFTRLNMQFLNHATTGDVPKFIQSMALFSTPLSDSDCQLLTT